MLEVKKISRSKYDDLTVKFASAIKLTCYKVIHGSIANYNNSNKEYPKNKYSERIYYALMGTRKNNYAYFTKEAGIREKMKSFSSEEYTSFIIEKARRVLKESEFQHYVLEQNGKYYIEESTIEYLIDLISKTILVNECIEIKPQVEIFHTNIKETVIKPQNVEFYKPSNELEKAILEGKQTSFKLTHANMSGMYAYSSVGNCRSNQEDSYYIGSHPYNEDFKLLLVADGMGGRNYGEIASNIAVKEMLLWFKSLDVQEYFSDNYQLKEEINKKIAQISNKIYRLAPGGGTTLCFAIIKKDNILIGNIGDSKAMVMENDKILTVTKSQNLPNAWGIPEPFDRFHKKGNVIFNFLGMPDNAPSCSFSEVPLKKEKEYQVMVYSDGVADLLGNEEVASLARSNIGTNIACNLVNASLNNTAYFQEEMNKLEKSYSRGEISYEEYSDILSRVNASNKKDYYEQIAAGKDNTTAVSITIRRGK